MEGERHMWRDARAKKVLEAATKAGRPVPALVTRNPNVEFQSIVAGILGPRSLDSEVKSLLQLTEEILKGEPEAT